mmetsp:Transcript_22847/g.17306  ORF Transcript_22847/g.17306 Transcript_22847/m.17306 type:complete len:156 (+) Transcript_22847:275-742(+)
MNRYVFTGGRDHKIKVWNTLGKCKFTIPENEHSGMVTCAKYFNYSTLHYVITGSSDKSIKVWEISTFGLVYTLLGHTSKVNSLDITPQSAFLASGSKDGKAIIWNLEEGDLLFKIDAECPINCVKFSPRRYWLVIGTYKGIKVWDFKMKAFSVAV